MSARFVGLLVLLSTTAVAAPPRPAPSPSKQQAPAAAQSSQSVQSPQPVQSAQTVQSTQAVQPTHSAQPTGTAQANQAAPLLTLQQAHATALRNRPVLHARQFVAQSAQQVTRQLESLRYPQVAANATIATATREDATIDGRPTTLDARIASGGLNNPTVLRRDAVGVVASQLITDFGRTAKLIESARFTEVSQAASVNATREDVILDVDNAYFAVLEADAVMQVAQKTVDARRLFRDRVAALARGKLKSELDVRFAQVALSEAQLLLLKARNGVEAAFARLSAALGYQGMQRYRLADPALPDAPSGELDATIRQALANRPELAGLKAEQQAASKLAEAQKALRYPSINAYAAAGAVPVGDPRFPDNYGAIGLNVSLTLFDGGKITALQREAQLHALAASESLTEAENNVAKGVQVAWLNVRAAWENITITDALVEAARQAAALAQTRYDLGLTSMVELNQAQLSEIDAEIGAARAKYDYLLARAALDYQVGVLAGTGAR